jgi:hypothetical protein
MATPPHCYPGRCCSLQHHLDEAPPPAGSAGETGTRKCDDRLALVHLSTRSAQWRQLESRTGRWRRSPVAVALPSSAERTENAGVPALITDNDCDGCDAVAYCLWLRCSAFRSASRAFFPAAMPSSTRWGIKNKRYTTTAGTGRNNRHARSVSARAQQQTRRTLRILADCAITA